MADGYSRWVIDMYYDLFPSKPNLNPGSRPTDVSYAQYNRGASDADDNITWVTSFSNIDIISFDTSYTNPSPVTGQIYWNSEHNVLNVKSDGEATMQVGLELWDRGHNSSGVTIVDGSVVYPQGIVGGLGDARLAKADSPITARWPLAIATVDILNGQDGQVTVFGDVNDIDTSGLSLGPVYLSDTVAGGMTSTPPTHPSIRYLLGFCKVVDAVNGVMFVMPRDFDILSFYNGTFRETFDFLVTSDGATITGTITRGDSNAGDLVMRFSTGEFVLDTTTTPLTITVTAGTLNSPQNNYFYVPLSTKVLTKSTVGWPSEQHIRVTFVRVADAGHTQTYGAMVNQNWNDHDAAIDTGQGHNSHTGQWVRRRQASYETGVDPNGATSSYFTIGAGTVDWISTVGEVWQMHPQVVDIINMSTGDGAIVTNWFGDTNHLVADLFEIVADSDGDGFNNNKYFNVFFFSIATKGVENNMLYVNLPSGQYTNLNLANTDSSGFDNNVIPDSYTKDSATGFPICRVTFQFGATWSIEAVVDLRSGFPAGISGGGGVVSPLTTFSDADFRVYSNLDIANIMGFDVSGLSTSRTITMPDSDITLHNIFTPGVVTAHTDITDAGSGAIITDNERNALDLLSLSGISSWVEITPANIANEYTHANQQAANIGVYFTGTGAEYLWFSVKVPSWLERYAEAQSKTVTATTMIVNWDDAGGNSDYITNMIIYHLPYDSATVNTQLSDTTNKGTSGSPTFRNTTYNFTDVVMDKGDRLQYRIQIQQASASKCRMVSFETTYTIA